MNCVARQVIGEYPRFQVPVAKVGSFIYNLQEAFSGRAARLACEQQMLIILGTGRSGNTLLRRLLMEKGSVYIPPESYVWSAQVYSFLRNPGMDWAEQVALALGRLEYSAEFETFGIPSLMPFAREAASWPHRDRSLGLLIQRLYFWIARETGVECEWVGEKTPMNLARIGLIGRMFPNAHFVYLERNAVDVAVSYRKSGLQPDVVATVQRWVSGRIAWKRFSRYLDKTRRFEISYADLVANSEQTTNDLLSAIGIPLRNRRLDVASLLGDVTSREHHKRVLQPVGEISRHDPVADLSLQERREIKRLLGRVALEPGYQDL